MQGWFYFWQSINAIHYINRLNKNYVILSTDEEKAYDKIQHLVMIKTLSKLGGEGNFLNPIRGVYLKKKKNHYSWYHDGDREGFSPTIWNRSRLSILTTLIQHHTANPSQQMEQEKEIKRHAVERKKTVPVHRWCDYLCRKLQAMYKKGCWN